MTTISQSALLPYSAEQMFALVNDIDSYPQFMDGCLGSEVLARTENTISARLDLGKAGLRYSFTTMNLLDPPDCMQMQLVDGPFKVFNAQWDFIALDTSACKVNYKMEFEFANAFVDTALKSLFDSTSKNLVNAVCKRAERLYGK